MRTLLSTTQYTVARPVLGAIPGLFLSINCQWWWEPGGGTAAFCIICIPVWPQKIERRQMSCEYLESWTLQRAHQILLVFCQPLWGVPTTAWARSSNHSYQQKLHSLQEMSSMQSLTNLWLAFVWDPWWIRMIMFDKEVSSLQNFRRWMKISVQIYLWNSIMCIQWSKMSTLWSPGLCCATMMVKTMARHDLHCDNMVRDRLQED